MKIDITQLNLVKGGTDFSYNDSAEDAVINALCYWYDLRSNGGTDGYDPRYDKLVRGSKIEIKISTSTEPYVEFAKIDDAASGVMVSTSDLYLFVSPGRTNGKKMYKARLVRTRELQRRIAHTIEQHPEQIIEFKRDSTGPGSKGVRIDFKEVDDLYVLGFDIVPGTNEKTFDTHQVHALPAYALQFMNQYIK